MVEADDANPFHRMGLHGLRAGFRLMWMCPARHCAGLWSLVLTDNAGQHAFEGGRLFVYAPATAESGAFLDTDVAVRTVDHPGQVRLADTGLLRSPACRGPLRRPRSPGPGPRRRLGDAPRAVSRPTSTARGCRPGSGAPSSTRAGRRPAP
ncbi:hypothetical protein GCM10023329_50550 [Streptomyces sanyensis]|uniref:Uncharacterized protein n=1 Tax=Streptomyces sanyensis TaxID=568869 RepID=A0ABP9BB80_9ACTN